MHGMQADIVVLATGYQLSTARKLLPESLHASAGYLGDDHWLYRQACDFAMLAVAGGQPASQPGT